MAVAKTSPPQPHVAVIAFPFTSHPMTLFKLVLRLARSSPDTLFTFLNTPKSNSALFPNDTQTNHHPVPPNLKRHDLDDGPAPEQGFARATEAFYNSLLRPGSIAESLSAAAAAGTRPVTCLLVDAVLSVFLADVAAEAGLPWVAVWSPSPFVLSAYVHTDLIRERCAAAAQDNISDIGELALDFVPGLSGIRVSDHWPREIVLGELDLTKFRFLQCLARLGHALPRASAVVLNTFRELNPPELNRDMESKFKELLNVGYFTVDAVAPAPRPSDPRECLTWLDCQDPDSVAYICFGTAAELSADELRAVAEALEETAVPFLWSLPDRQRRLLPGGFTETSGSYGKVVTWADQGHVLRHRSVGVHVTHCGWNSVNESLANGVPVIARPFWADNQMNARMVEGVWEIGRLVGVETTRTGLVEALRTVLKREEGVKMRERALAFKGLVLEGSGPCGSGTRDFNALLELLTAV